MRLKSILFFASFALLAVSLFGDESPSTESKDGVPPCEAIEPATSYDLPPLWTVERDVKARDEQFRLRLIGPIGERRETGEGRTVQNAIRPLWSHELDSGNWAMDFIWPVSVWRDAAYGKFNWILLYFSADDPGKPSCRRHLIPLWFSGIDGNGEFYWGLFPMYGDVKDFISYDRVRFALFPLYWRTEKNGTEGEGYLWPIVNWDSGPRSDKTRVLPFYAYNSVFGEYYSQSFMWPFFHTTKSMNENVPGEGWMAWPLYGRNTWKDKDSWSVIWPLFMYSKRGEDGFRLHCPWPIFQYGRNMEKEGEYLLSIWPLWGRRLKCDGEADYFIFPLGWYLEDRGEDRHTEWLWLLPLYWHKSVHDKSGKERISLYRRFWPFASYYEDATVCRVKGLDIWPQRNFRVIERNWDPIWALFTYEARGEASALDILWGMARSHNDGKGGGRFALSPFYDAKWEVGLTSRDYFFGALRTVDIGEGSKVRILWLLEFNL